ncbi:MAG TPA: flagellin, partial [Comamonas denitrificans]|nr:flagellin [Comamonas denitrificans]
MAATINTNIASINAQRNLTFSGQSLNTTMQRLSSGLRVNSAKDDAAGLAISERMNTQVKGLTVASRNASDGISLAQTTEGALGKIGDMLQRMRELAVQAGNATNSKGDREALQLEVKQLADEVDRVAKQTNFNGQKVLDGSFAGAVFQVGANSGDNITLGALVDTRAEKISSISYASSSQTNIDTADPGSITSYVESIDAGDLAIILNPGGATNLPALPPASSQQERLGQVIEAINNKSADTGVVAYLTKQEGSEKYTVEIMSGKTDTNGDPVIVAFSGFSTTLTGI